MIGKLLSVSGKKQNKCPIINLQGCIHLYESLLLLLKYIKIYL